MYRTYGNQQKSQDSGNKRNSFYILCQHTFLSFRGVSNQQQSNYRLNCYSNTVTIQLSTLIPRLFPAYVCQGSKYLCRQMSVPWSNVSFPNQCNLMKMRKHILMCICSTFLAVFSTPYIMTQCLIRLDTLRITESQVRILEVHSGWQQLQTYRSQGLGS